ncbi:3-deoxy-D-manno-octulosonic acid transferase [Orrella sp. 11846]|uniref:3-deoxy-D-manno-octulosonic acid transferase n=1 Tax=Orrella sp. 11846 TaxID=3409913 RepID=UPI003B59C36A
MGRLIYSALLVLAAPFVWLWMWLRTRKTTDHWDIFAHGRFGYYTQPWDGAHPIWVHAVSVGEVRASVPLVKALVLRGERIVLTHMTPTGKAEAQRLFAEEIARGFVIQKWIPYDFPGAMRRFLKHFRPQKIILIEREVWPNLVYAANRAHIPVILVSARFSEKSAKQNQTLDRLLLGVMRHTYEGLTLVLAQTSEDGERLYDAGAQRIQVCGNLKFDLDLPKLAVEAGQAWRSQVNRPVIVIASTRDGEEAQFIPLLTAQSDLALHEDELVPDPHSIEGDVVSDVATISEEPTQVKPLFVIVPRHPQRFDEVARELSDTGMHYARWSLLRDAPGESIQTLDVVLGDTMGELPFFYGAADVAIVGGSFEPFGGQNFIEASAVGVPVIVGPNIRNFKDAVESALQAGVLSQVSDAKSAVDLARRWIAQPQKSQGIGQTGQSWVAQHVGATQRILACLDGKSL